MIDAVGRFLRSSGRSAFLLLIVSTIAAVSHAELTDEEVAIDEAIQETWSHFLGRLEDNDAAGAAGFINPTIRKQYLQIFESMGGQLHELASEWSNIKAVQLSKSFSEYTIFTGNGSDERMHFVSFSKRHGASWMISTM